MKIDNIALHSFFIKNKIYTLHHANSVGTSISFINSYGLLSRGDIERHGLFQTEQMSDQEDKIYDVWDDIFLDTTDLHGFFPRQNIYGPVSFKFSIDFLLENNLDIWITKQNPMYWDPQKKDTDKYFQDMNDIMENWNNYARQDTMITIKKPRSPRLFNQLQSILLDDPNIVLNNIVLYNESEKLLLDSLQKNGLPLHLLSKRTCKQCFCKKNYLNQLTESSLKKMFLSPNHSFW